MSRFTSMTAWTSSYFLFKLRIATRAMFLSLYRPADPGHVILDKERVDEGHRDRAQQRPGHEFAPKEHVPAHEFGGDPNRHRLLLRRGQGNEGIDEFIPGQRDGEDAGRQNARDRRRKDDVTHRLPTRRAVDAGALFK